MKWILKAGLLVTLLAIPVLIYLFLQIFGQNYYSLPIYYQDELPDKIQNCSNLSSPSRVNWNSIDELTTKLDQNKITIFVALADDCDQQCQIKFNQANRLANNFIDQDSLQIVLVVIRNHYEDSIGENTSELQNLRIINLDSQNWQHFSQCELLLPFSDLEEIEEINQFVLLDGKNRIRGYYNGLSLEDIDRLTTEIRLLLYEYQHQT